MMIFRAGAGGPEVSGSDSSQGGMTWAGTWPRNIKARLNEKSKLRLKFYKLSVYQISNITARVYQKICNLFENNDVSLMNTIRTVRTL